jgi:cytoskeletal protein CcmA (bactofilin family)
MAIFGRKREDAPVGTTPGADTTQDSPPAVGTAAAAMRDAEFGVPPFRPVPKDASSMSLPPKPTAAAMPVAGQRPASAASPSVAMTSPVGRPPQRQQDAVERRTLVVGRGISLQGTVSDAERLVVEGTVESEMIQAAELYVAQAGVFRGEVQVEDAEIAGLFDGTITARGNLVIRETGKVTGTARYRKLSVEEGGVVSGRMETISEASGAPMGGNGLGAHMPRATGAPPASSQPPSPYVMPADAEV